MEGENRDAELRGRVEYVVVNESMLGYREFGGEVVRILSAPDHDPMIEEYPVRLTVDAVRPATVENFAQYQVDITGDMSLSKPLIPVLAHHLMENVPLDRLDPGKVAQELRARTLEYAWATRKTPESLLQMADSLDSLAFLEQQSSQEDSLPNESAARDSRVPRPNDNMLFRNED
jgi:hypothetical protein